MAQEFYVPSPVKPLLFSIAWLKVLLCYMIHYGTYRGAVVGLRGAAVGVRGAAVGNIGIPTYVISRGAVVRQPTIVVITSIIFRGLQQTINIRR